MVGCGFGCAGLFGGVWVVSGVATTECCCGWLAFLVVVDAQK